MMAITEDTMETLAFAVAMRRLVGWGVNLKEVSDDVQRRIESRASRMHECASEESEKIRERPTSTDELEFVAMIATYATFGAAVADDVMKARLAERN